VLTLVQAKYIL